MGGQRPVRPGVSIRLSSRLSFNFPSNNNPPTVPPEMEGEAQLRIE